MKTKKNTLRLDLHSRLPIYSQIVEQIQNQMANGLLRPGDQLPTVRALAVELGVNFNTVARAYRILDDARIISTQQGRGTYITRIPPTEFTEKLRKESLSELTSHFIGETLRLGFSKQEIGQMVRDGLRLAKEKNANS